MSITRHMAELLVAEHKFQPICGEVLLLGRQQVFLTPDEAQALVNKASVARAPNAFVKLNKLPHAADQISDASFFSLFSDATVQACDVSDYEGAEFVFDLSGQVPSSLLGRFDFIYNGSVFDNVFDPAACIRNVTRMLKPDGRVISYEGAAHASPAYLKFSPDWFFEYYALNGFEDCQVYVATYDDILRDPWKVYQYDGFTPEGHVTWPMRLPPEALVVAIAQNSPSATIDKIPIQGHYRGGNHTAYLPAFTKYKASPRRAAILDLFQPIASPRKQTQSFFSGLFGAQEQVPQEPVAPGHSLLGMLGAA